MNRADFYDEARKSGVLSIIKIVCKEKYYNERVDISMFVFSKNNVQADIKFLQPIEDFDKLQKLIMRLFGAGSKMCMYDTENEWMEWNGSEFSTCQSPYAEYFL